MSKEVERLQAALNVAITQRNDAQNALVEQLSDFAVQRSELESKIKELELKLEELKNGKQDDEEEKPRNPSE